MARVKELEAVVHQREEENEILPPDSCGPHPDAGDTSHPSSASGFSRS
jgi:hypothetical protein